MTKNNPYDPYDCWVCMSNYLMETEGKLCCFPTYPEVICDLHKAELDELTLILKEINAEETEN